MAPRVEYIILDGTSSEGEPIREDDSSSSEDEPIPKPMPVDEEHTSESSEEESMSEDVCICETCIWEREHNMIVRGGFSVLMCSFDSSCCSTCC